ncbi:MAG: CBS domain-containing protein [Fimbriimonadaceae bacterium]|nr:CBS domain-containing protein [Fimbriimonadaceae bacterium]
MPYPIKNIIEGNSKPLTTSIEESAATALELMVEHDYSQLPVVDQAGVLVGMVSSESILRSVRAFKQLPEHLRVQDCYKKVSAYLEDAELFDVLTGLEDDAAVVITDGEGRVSGIVTDFDTARYFRQRAENAMLVEDIEVTIREYITLAFPNRSTIAADDFACAIEQAKIPDQELIPKATAQGAKGFEDLNFSQYVSMWLCKDRWPQYAPVVSVDRLAIGKMLNRVRLIRNKIAHFRGDVTNAESADLTTCRDWLQNHKAQLLTHFGETEQVIEEELRSQEEAIQEAKDSQQAEDLGDLGSEDSSIEMPNVEPSLDVEKVSKYSALGRWLRGIPPDIETTWITFLKIEHLIGVPLPPSATRHRSWWANDWTSHSQSKLWLGEGWETDIVDMTNERVRFRRIP